jgi:ABC-type uncharacterized transport system permease subunit
MTCVCRSTKKILPDLIQLHRLSGVSLEPQPDFFDELGIGAGIFALILFVLSIYSWSRKMPTSLIFVSIVFLLFFLKVVLEVPPNVGNTLQFVSVVLDFIILALFFITTVIRPRIKVAELTDDLER